MVVVVGYGSSCSRVGYQGVGGWTAAWAFLELQSELALPQVALQGTGFVPSLLHRWPEPSFLGAGIVAWGKDFRIPWL